MGRSGLIVSLATLALALQVATCLPNAGGVKQAAKSQGDFCKDFRSLSVLLT
jgi:hypothetical protein